MSTALQHAVALRRRLACEAVAPSEVRAALAEVPASEWDAWMDALWDGADVPDDGPHLPRGGVPYLPCPVATILGALQAADVTASDVFVDLGAGLGRALALAHLWTGADCIGVEIQPHLVAAARTRAASLAGSRIRMLEGDAAELIGSIADGRVFFMYSPFGGARLTRVLEGLQALARAHPIRLCCVEMPDLQAPWLVRVDAPSPELAIYRSDDASLTASRRKDA